MNELLKKFNLSPKYSIKWSNYFDIYKNLLSKYKKKKITLVEIGIGDGGSLYMWRSFLHKKSNIIGVDLNPEAKKLEKDGFKIIIGDQSKKEFWKSFFKKVGKVDILIDDGGHTNIQQITTLVESVNFIKNGGKIIIEDTHTSFMSKKGFNNPSKYSLVSFSSSLIENLHRRNPNIKKKMNTFSKKIFSIEYFDSIVSFNIDEKKCGKTKNLENNKKLKKYFIDYRFKKDLNKNKKNNWFNIFFEKNFSKRSVVYKVYERLLIRKYYNLIKKKTILNNR